MPKMWLCDRATISKWLCSVAVPHGVRMSHQPVHCPVQAPTAAQSPRHRWPLSSHSKIRTSDVATTMRLVHSQLARRITASRALSTNNTTHRLACTVKSLLRKHLPLRLRFWPVVCSGKWDEVRVPIEWSKLTNDVFVLFCFVNRVNFKKNEKVYNSAGSEVLKALQDAEKDPHQEPGNFYATFSKASNSVHYLHIRIKNMFCSNQGRKKCLLFEEQLISSFCILIVCINGTLRFNIIHSPTEPIFHIC